MGWFNDRTKNSLRSLGVLVLFVAIATSQSDLNGDEEAPPTNPPTSSVSGGLEEDPTAEDAIEFERASHVETFLPEEELAQRGHWQHRHVRRGNEFIDIDYLEVDKHRVFQGDILLDDELLDVLSQDTANTTLLGGIWFHSLFELRRRWPCPVPYRIQYGYQNPRLITGAISEITRLTNWRFVERTNETDYMFFQTATGCGSYVGRLGGPQPVFLHPFGCNKAVAMHEIFHALGAWHEQARSDRDSFITINTTAIHSFARFNFDTEPFQQTVGSYDFNSVMHYGRWDFANSGNPTITPVSGQPGPGVCFIGQRDTLSRGDVATAAALLDPSRYCPVSQKTYNECGTNGFRLCHHDERHIGLILNGFYRNLTGLTNGRPRWKKRNWDVPGQARVYAYWSASAHRWVIGSALGGSSVFAIAYGSANTSSPAQATNWLVYNQLVSALQPSNLQAGNCTA